MTQKISQLILIAVGLLLVGMLGWPTEKSGVSSAVAVTPTMLVQPDAATKARVEEAYGKLPLSFEANQGQTNAQVKFLSRGSSYTLFLTPAEAVLTLRQPSEAKETVRTNFKKLETRSPMKSSGTKLETVLRMKLIGANASPKLVGMDQLSGKSNYFTGNDPKKWAVGVPNYAKVKYEEVYPGIDLIYYGNQRQLEYDFIVSPGANPKVITLGFEGVVRANGRSPLQIDGEGNLVLNTAGGQIQLQKPVIYQEINGIRQKISGGYVLLLGHETRSQTNSAGTKPETQYKVGFQVAAYHTGKPLVIDPMLVYSTYLGGSNTDRAYGIAVDSSGNAYVTGETYSLNFPTANPLQGTKVGCDGTPSCSPNDAFVTKFNATGSQLIYSTYFGGSNEDVGNDIAVDSSENVYLTGQTNSTDFPTWNPAQPFSRGSRDAFVAKLDSSGSQLLYSTYLGGSGSDTGQGITVTKGAKKRVSAYVIGKTTSIDFPTVNAFQQVYGGGAYDAFVAKLNLTGSELVYSTYLGGSADDAARGLAVDSAKNAYVTGLTDSTDFPTTANPYQPTNSGTDDAFVVKLSRGGSALVYSTYLGSDGGEDQGNGIAVDSAGNAYVTGITRSADFPTKDPLQPTNGSAPCIDTAKDLQEAVDEVFARCSNDAFVTKLNPAGSELVYSTYLGGENPDAGYRIAVDALGNAYVSGATFSPNFPTANPVQPVYGGGLSDAFVTKVNPQGSALVYSTYLGGGREEDGYGLAIDPVGNAYVAGVTNSTDFPTVNPVQPDNGFDVSLDPRNPADLPYFVDAFVAKISDEGNCIALGLPIDQDQTCLAEEPPYDPSDEEEE